MTFDENSRRRIAKTVLQVERSNLNPVTQPRIKNWPTPISAATVIGPQVAQLNGEPMPVKSQADDQTIVGVNRSGIRTRFFSNSHRTSLSGEVDKLAIVSLSVRYNGIREQQVPLRGAPNPGFNSPTDISNDGAWRLEEIERYQESFRFGQLKEKPDLWDWLSRDGGTCRLRAVVRRRGAQSGSEAVDLMQRFYGRLGLGVELEPSSSWLHFSFNFLSPALSSFQLHLTGGPEFTAGFSPSGPGGTATWSYYGHLLLLPIDPTAAPTPIPGDTDDDTLPIVPTTDVEPAVL